MKQLYLKVRLVIDSLKKKGFTVETCKPYKPSNGYILTIRTDKEIKINPLCNYRIERGKDITTILLYE